MTTTQRREDGRRLMERTAAMNQAVHTVLERRDIMVDRAELVLLKLNAAIVNQIARAVSNTLLHTLTPPAFAPVMVTSMIDAVAEAYHELTGDFMPYSVDLPADEL